ncbi:hypothetical protein [Achromobacter anxifer]|jgi:hypothetical protein|nr:hypothetical protein [Achromobacter anxifer]MDF8362171.1 hypothetical protein [Achromobacter anxifer]
MNGAFGLQIAALERALPHSEDHMTEAESEELEELLMTWHRWAKAYREHLGYSRVAPGFRDVSDQDGYGDDDETAARLNRHVAEQVDACLNALPLDLRAAVGISLRNKDAPQRVFRNPRCSPEEQQRRYREAQSRLLPMLRRQDVMQVAAQGLAYAVPAH